MLIYVKVHTFVQIYFRVLSPCQYSRFVSTVLVFLWLHSSVLIYCRAHTSVLLFFRVHTPFKSLGFFVPTVLIYLGLHTSVLIYFKVHSPG